MKLIILGAGKYGREIADVARQTNRFDDIAFLDDNAGDAANVDNPTLPRILGRCDSFPRFIDENCLFFPAFGDNVIRAHWLQQLIAANAQLTNIIHPTAYISPTAELGIGVAILPKALINTSCIIKDGSIINSGAIVDHDTIVDTCAHICVGAIVKADNHIPAMLKVEAGVVIERNTYR